MSTGIAICLGCSKPKEGEFRGNAVVVDSDNHLKLLQQGHNNWAGKAAEPLHQLVLLNQAELTPAQQAAWVIGLLPSSSILLGEVD